MDEMGKKIKRLEREISRYKTETSRTRRLQNEAKLKARIGEEQLKKREAELERIRSEFERSSREEKKRLKRERLKFEKKYKELVSLPARQEREEVSEAQRQLTSFKSKAKKTEEKLRSTVERLKMQVGMLTRENATLKQELQETETSRLRAVEQVKGLKAAMRKQSESQKRRSISRSVDQHRSNPVFSDGTGFVDITGGNEAADGAKRRSAWGVEHGRAEAKGSRHSDRPHYDAAMYADDNVGGPKPAAVQRADKLSKANPLFDVEDGVDTPSVSIERHTGIATRPSTKTAPQKKLSVQERLERMNRQRASKVDKLLTFQYDCHLDLALRLGPVEREVHYTDGKLEKKFKDGAQQIIYTNGTRKHVLKGGYSQIAFPNGDTKEMFPEGKVIYHFAAADITQITYGKMETFYFGNNQLETHFEDGTKEIYFGDGTAKFISDDGVEYNLLEDGQIYRVSKGSNRFDQSLSDTLR